MRIVGYHRPTDIDQALGLLSRSGVRSVVLGGGTLVNRHGGDEAEAVDLQALELDRIGVADGRVDLGSMVRLSHLADTADVPAWLRDLARRELPSTLRSVATVGGTVASASADSQLIAGLLVCDALVSLATASARFDLPLPQYLHDREAIGAHVITAVSVAATNAITIEDNHIAGAFYLDGSLSYDFNIGEKSTLQTFFNVRNILNRSPAYVPQGPTDFTYVYPLSKGSSGFDLLGREFLVGVRLRM